MKTRTLPLSFKGCAKRPRGQSRISLLYPRPLLLEECYGNHNDKRPTAGLVADICRLEHPCCIGVNRTTMSRQSEPPTTAGFVAIVPAISACSFNGFLEVSNSLTAVGAGLLRRAIADFVAILASITIVKPPSKDIPIRSGANTGCSFGSLSLPPSCVSKTEIQRSNSSRSDPSRAVDVLRRLVRVTVAGASSAISRVSSPGRVVSPMAYPDLGLTSIPSGSLSIRN